MWMATSPHPPRRHHRCPRQCQCRVKMVTSDNSTTNEGVQIPRPSPPIAENSPTEAVPRHKKCIGAVFSQSPESIPRPLPLSPPSRRSRPSTPTGMREGGTKSVFMSPSSRAVAGRRKNMAALVTLRRASRGSGDPDAALACRPLPLAPATDASTPILT